MDPASLVFNIVMVVIALLTLIATVVTMHHAINIEQKLTKKRYEYELLGKINGLYYEFEKEIVLLKENKAPILSEDDYLNKAYSALYEIKDQAMIYDIGKIFNYADGIICGNRSFDKVSIIELSKAYFKKRKAIEEKETDYSKIGKKLEDALLDKIRKTRNENLTQLRKGL